MSENNTTGSTKPKRLLTQNSDLRRIGVFNWTLPAFVIEMPDGSHFNVCPQAGVCAQRIAALTVSHAGRVALQGGCASVLCRVATSHRVPLRVSHCDGGHGVWAAGI
ncbi:hypothetical protein JHN59_25810 [Streptomyces sp. MBT49]|uniref:GP88 family protein n=1 Tax=Streptomyces sp. MBT49 TaxID=1488380 RepID=UPI00190C258B|nr:hypothetical protein [Streptomyces sp. MBT49]MBK3628200.1 hypothetical protein [Streptomyces sp. MBT49]